jgi:NADH-quinone oxidoreductase subunit I
MWTVPPPPAHDVNAEQPKEVVDALKAAEAGESR